MQSRQWILFRSFFMISAVTLGGGLAMIPVIQRTFTEKYKWLTEEGMADIVAVTQSSPGVIATNIAVLTGYRIAGVRGALSAAFGASLPPFFSIVVIASIFRSLSASATINGIFTGVRAAICALILSAVIRMSGKIVKGKFELILAVAGFIGMMFDMNAILLVVLSGAAGILRTVFGGRKEAE